jgi:hypothetical protein
MHFVYLGLEYVNAQAIRLVAGHAESWEHVVGKDRDFFNISRPTLKSTQPPRVERGGGFFRRQNNRSVKVPVTAGVEGYEIHPIYHTSPCRDV